MTAPTVSCVTIREGRCHYRQYADGSWEVLMWGWWPYGNGTPRYLWMTIPADKVPQAVKDAARGEKA